MFCRRSSSSLLLLLSSSSSPRRLVVTSSPSSFIIMPSHHHFFFTGNTKLISTYDESSCDDRHHHIISSSSSSSSTSSSRRVWGVAYYEYRYKYACNRRNCILDCDFYGVGVPLSKSRASLPHSHHEPLSDDKMRTSSFRWRPPVPWHTCFLVILLRVQHTVADVSDADCDFSQEEATCVASTQSMPKGYRFDCFPGCECVIIGKVGMRFHNATNRNMNLKPLVAV